MENTQFYYSFTPMIYNLLYLSLAMITFLTNVLLGAQQPTEVSKNFLDSKILSAVVVIHGDNGSGTGFFVESSSGNPIIISNQHVILGCNKILIKSINGDIIPYGKILTALDEDVVAIQPLVVPQDITALKTLYNLNDLVKKNDETCVPGNSKGDGVITQTFGKVIAVGPNLIETDTPVYPGNSGSPVIHLKTGKVIGVLTKARLLKMDEFEKASFRNSKSAIQSEIRYFSYRLDTIKGWNSTPLTYLNSLQHKIDQSIDELICISEYFSGSSNRYKEFTQLHNYRNKAVDELNSNFDNTTKLNSYSNFLRNLEYLIENANYRVLNSAPCFTQANQIDQIKQMSLSLKNGVDIAKKDNDLTRALIDSN